MTINITRRHLIISAVVLALCVAATGIWTGAVLADPPYAIEDEDNRLALSWTLAASGAAPYTEPTPGELHALKVAEEALVEPPLILIRNADHGYLDCIAKLEATRELVDAVPMIVGHELVLYNDTKAVRMFVNADGIVTPIVSGGTDIEPEDLRGLGGAGEYAAAEIARSAMCLHSQLDPETPYCDMRSMLSGYGVGFANEEGTHLIIRVGVNDAVSCPEW